MRFRFILGALIVLAAASRSPSQEVPVEAWERLLEDEPGLIENIKASREAIEERDVSALAGQFRSGKVLLIMRAPPLPASLYAPSQAQALLADFLARQPNPGLRIGLIRREPDGDRIHVALDAQKVPSGDRRGRRRFVVIYDREAAGWRLAELRCL